VGQTGSATTMVCGGLGRPRQQSGLREGAAPACSLRFLKFQHWGILDRRCRGNSGIEIGSESEWHSSVMTMFHNGKTANSICMMVKLRSPVLRMAKLPVSLKL
jgi:hypothetical protein